MSNEEFRIAAYEIWRHLRGTDMHPTEAEKKVLLAAYWESCLPKDPDYSLEQWVEDGFPGF